MAGAAENWAETVEVVAAVDQADVDDAWAEEDRLGDEAYAAMFDSWEYRLGVLKDRLAGIWCALTSTSGDLSDSYWTPVERFWLRWLCVVAILANRSGFEDREGNFWTSPGHRLHALSVGGWGFTKLYAGWRETQLHFHPVQMRFEIIEDGDWCM